MYKYNNGGTVGLPSTDPSTWDAVYEIRDKVKIRVDLRPASPVYEIFSIDTHLGQYVDEKSSGIQRPQNPSGRLYFLTNNGGTWEGKDLELVKKNQSGSPTSTISLQQTTPSPTQVPVIQDTDTLKQIVEEKNENLKQLLFLKDVISALDFEKKLEINQKISNTQAEINQSLSQLFENKVGTDNMLDELFEQSFMDLQHTYSDVYSQPDASAFIAPDHTPSKLSDQLNELIRTKAFLDWFGNFFAYYAQRKLDFLNIPCSKVLNSNGEPQIVWHGTGAEFSYFRFDSFPGAYFAVNKEYSQFFAELQGGEDGFVIPFFLNVRNPLDLTYFTTKLVPPDDFFAYFYLQSGLSMEDIKDDIHPIFNDPSCPAHETWMYLRNSPKLLKKIADMQLFDGIHFYETNPNIPDTSNPAHSTEAWMVFDAKNIKLADNRKSGVILASLRSFLLSKGGKL